MAEQNKTTPSKTNRRKFCGIVAGSALGAFTGVGCGKNETEPGAGGTNSSPAAPGQTTVALVRDAKVWKGDSIKFTEPERLRAMVDRAVCLATGRDDPLEAWKQIAKPQDVVGLKINCLGGHTIATRPDLVEAVTRSLIEAGVQPGNVIIWDRSDRELTAGGFPIQKSADKVRCFGTPGMCDEEFDAGGVATRISTIITETCDVIVNMPVLKAHVIAGYSGALKNFMGAIPNAPKFHPDRCLKVADLNTFEPFRKKTRLIIMDALRPLYDKGPGDSPAHRWKYNGLLAGVDPVALDQVALSILEDKRREVKGEEWPADVPLIARAAELGVGEGDLDKIHVALDEKA